ncbi:enoyl-CoA hydratase/isomerase family protein [Caballeronia sp. LZ001]|uniref:enoyl-CoA hydratase/isomerase family protein n=1 Tax=Caballeronia sp. LZ001 TaxID=3038553 RepID=UPI00285D627E|nr:enoyl-CoA hydratase/isomerase family protein [Caballeronia sp. LZ001]MDR5804856.1 enoyl-CoA hydratase/isomerase family protein [Caballeronia sp. LZ001]
MPTQSAADSAASSGLQVRDDGRVRIVCINRPERSNALSSGLMIELGQRALEADEDSSVDVVVLTATGTRVFCAGADLKEMREGDEEGKRFRPPRARIERSVFEIVHALRKPVLAALNGSAVGGGLELALACDVRVSHPGAKFGLPEARIGLGAHFGSVILPRIVPPAVALEMVMTGELVDAQRAAQIGLLNHLVQADQVLETTLCLARTIAANAPLSVRRVKALAKHGAALPAEAALALDPGPSPYTSSDRVEGIRAKSEGRAPNWTGQ